MFLFYILSSFCRVKTKNKIGKNDLALWKVGADERGTEELRAYQFREQEVSGHSQGMRIGGWKIEVECMERE